MAEIKLVFKPDGTLEVQGVPGEDAARKLAWLLKDMGEVTKKGHRHGAGEAAGVQLEQKG